jgi:hypothetical protein
MAKADKKTRGRTSITESAKAGQLGPKPSHPMKDQERRTTVSRPQGAGGGKLRGDRRDMNKAYTGNAKHSARGNTPRVNVATRKD